MTAGLETFAKVRALHDSTNSPGEKAAAMVKMQTLARKAGMSVEEAVSILDVPAPKPRNLFEDLFNTPEFRASQAEREHQRAIRRAAALAEYGSEDAVWEPCWRERALEEACRPVITRKPIIGGEMDTLMGWDGGRIDTMPAEVREAVATAFPTPTTPRVAWDEFSYWEKRSDDRSAFSAYADPVVWVRARTTLLQHLLDTLPSLSLNDLRARMSWMRYLNDLEYDRGNPENRRLIDQLAADIERLGARIREQDADAVQDGQTPIQPGESFTGKPQNCGVDRGDVQDGQSRGDGIQHPPLRRTNADKRRDVLALLQANAEKPGIALLSDREIARRAGVSPQTVGNIRRSAK